MIGPILDQSGVVKDRPQMGRLLTNQPQLGLFCDRLILMNILQGIFVP